MNPTLTPPTPDESNSQAEPAVVGITDVHTHQLDEGLVSTTFPPKRPKRRRVLLVVSTIAILVVGAGVTSVFAWYLPSRPDALYATALERTGKGYDVALNTLKSSPFTSAKSLEEKATFSLKATGIAGDGTYTSKGNASNGIFGLSVGINGTRIAVDGVLKTPNGATAPDVYIKPAGIKGLGSSFGYPNLDTIDKQWIVIDHTLLEAASSQLVETATPALPTEKQLIAALEVMGTVSKTYVFTGDESKQIMQQSRFVGTENEDRREVHHYKVKLNKANARTFVAELMRSLDDSKFGEWTSAVLGEDLSGSSYEQSVLKSIDSINDTETFDMWIDASTKLLYKIRLTDVADEGTYVDIGLPIENAKTLPLSLLYKVDNAKTKGSITLNTSYDSISNTARVDAKLALAGKDGVSGSVSYEVTPMKAPAPVVTPSNAMPLLEALDQTGLRSLVDEYLSSVEEPGKSSEESVIQALFTAPVSRSIQVATSR